MKFQDAHRSREGRRLLPAQQQADAWEAVIKQDSYLSAHRGQYAGRNAVFLPMAKRADFSIVQEVFGKVKGARNALQFRLDILNVGNLLNKNWGLGETFLSTANTATPLGSPSADASGKLTYTLAVNGSGAAATLITTLMKQTTSRRTTSTVSSSAAGTRSSRRDAVRQVTMRRLRIGGRRVVMYPAAGFCAAQAERTLDLVGSP